MPTSTLGIIIDGQKISDIMGVVNATLGDMKPLLVILLGGWLAFFVISFIIGLVKKRAMSGRENMTEKQAVDDYFNGWDDDDDFYDDDDDDF
jgi:hypothetical protein